MKSKQTFNSALLRSPVCTYLLTRTSALAWGW